MLYSYDRTEEQQSMLDQMVAIVAKEKPDVFILAGDVYDTVQPDAEVQTMLTEAIVRLHDANPSMHLIITASVEAASCRIQDGETRCCFGGQEAGMHHHHTLRAIRRMDTMAMVFIWEYFHHEIYKK